MKSKTKDTYLANLVLMYEGLYFDQHQTDLDRLREELRFIQCHPPECNHKIETCFKWQNFHARKIALHNLICKAEIETYD